MTAPALDPQDFRNAMSKFASGVTIVTTHAPDGTPVGFTASAFSSLSLNPPLALVCLDRTAECFDAFMATDTFGISILQHGQDGLAMRFATRGADKFGSGDLSPGAVTGTPLVDAAIARIECNVHERFDGGDHVVIVGEVVSAAVQDGEPLLHYARQFGRFAADGA
ncbi:MAG: flavin reductase family protein [Dehalococcoidia bacterium]